MKTSATSSIDVPELDTFDLRETVVALLNEELQQERAKRKDAEAKAGRRKTRLRALKQKLEEDSNPNLIDKVGIDTSMTLIASRSFLALTSMSYG